MTPSTIALQTTIHAFIMGVFDFAAVAILACGVVALIHLFTRTR